MFLFSGRVGIIIYLCYDFNINNTMNVKRFGVSLEENLLVKLDALVKKQRFPNRSQAIRFLIQKNLVLLKVKQGNLKNWPTNLSR